MRAILLVAAIMLAGLAAAACGGGGSSLVPAKTNGQQDAAVSVASPQGNTSGNKPAATSSDLFEVTLSGAVTARWKSGDKGAGVSCRLLGDQLFAGVFGTIGSNTYQMGFNEAVLTTGNFVYPNSDNGSQKSPGLQLTTSSNAKAQWDMAGSRGKGNVTFSGAKGAPLNAVIEGDMQDNLGGAAVHVSGSFRCTPATSAP